jgi:hypothetical protein
MSDRGIGDNGGPPLQKFTAKHKIDRIREVLDMDITAHQKCVGVGIIVEADADGIAAELSTKRLQTFASVSDRETVYRATRVLEDKEVTKAIKVKGKPNSYRVLPPAVMEAIVKAYNQVKTSRVEPDIPSPVKPDTPVGSNPTAPETEAVCSHPTTLSNPVGSEPTSQVSPDEPSRARIEPPSGVNIINKQTSTATTVESEAAQGGGGYLDDLNGTATDLIAFIGKHARVEPDTARNMLGNNTKAFTSEAMIEAFSVTLAKMSEDYVAKPYTYLIEAARGIRDDKVAKAAKARAKADQPSKSEDRKARAARIAAGIEAEKISGRRPQ